MTLAYVLPLLGTRLLASRIPESSVPTAAGLVWTVVLPVVALTALGWWRLAGFTIRPTWRRLVPLWPLVVLYVVVPLAVLPALVGVADHTPGYLALVVVAALSVGFGDEALFRGVVLQALLPSGTLRAVIISAVLWAASYLGVIAAGVNPVLAGVQALHMVGMGVAFAAAVVVTGTIRPLVIIDAATQVPYFILPAANSRPDPVTVVVELTMGALAAAYGLWLLHRDRRGHPPRLTPPAPPPARTPT